MATADPASVVNATTARTTTDRRGRLRVVPSYLPRSRVEAFSDGVIAIIVTILVLEVKVPHVTGPDAPDQLWHAMLDAIPLVVAYAGSFVVVLVFWVAHHHLCHSLRRVDRNTLWLNGLFLMVLAFVPAPTALVGHYPGSTACTVLYGAVLALCGLAFVALRAYTTVTPGLMHEDISPVARRKALRRGALSPLLYVAASLSGLWSRHLAWALYFLIPCLFILPGAFDRAAHQIEH